MAGLFLISLRSAFEPILTSTFTRDIGLQFLITPHECKSSSIIRPASNLFVTRKIYKTQLRVITCLYLFNHYLSL